MIPVNILIDSSGNIIKASRDTITEEPGLKLVEGIEDTPDSFQTAVPLFDEVPGVLFDDCGRCIFRLADKTIVPGAARWPDTADLKYMMCSRICQRLDTLLLTIISLERWQSDSSNTKVRDRSAELEEARSKFIETRDTLAGS